MKSARHDEIIRIINENKVDTQEMLRKLLEDRGIEVTQATLSRDMRELRLKKVSAEGGGQRYAVSENTIPDLPQLFTDSVYSADHAVNTVVFRCNTGMAQAACAVFDQLNFRSVVGTIAGDDTIFVLMRTAEEAAELSDEINSAVRKQ